MITGRPLFRLFAVASIVGSFAMFAAPQRAAAQPPGFPVVASGLDNPRGLTFGPDGTMYVAEAGRGGTEACFEGPEGGQVCYGTTGAITRVAGGQQSRLVSGLGSIAGEDGSAATGPHDVAVAPNGSVYATIGLGANPSVRSSFGPGGANLGQLTRVSSAGEVQYIADLAGYEASANPDGSEVPDSNPYGLAALNDKRLAVDAGGNTLLEIGSDNSIKTLAVFPQRIVPAPPFPGLPPELPMDAVPDAVAVGPDGSYYVGQLTGFPFPIGGARVYRVPAGGGTPEIYADGFTNIIDLTVASDGSLYVLELVTKGLLQAEGPDGDLTGALIRVAPTGGRQIVASAGLIAPGGVAIGPDGGLYVTNFSILPQAGAVVRVGQVDTTPLPPTSVDGAPVYFPETGYALGGEFLSFWEAHGGLAVFGYPITSERKVDARVQQWLERARFELHPQHKAPYNVQLGRLGVEVLAKQGRDWTGFAKASPSAAHYFRETGQAIAPEFWSYWSSNGLEFDGRRGKSAAESLALFGFPISPAQVETNANGDRVLTQWFERARFEYHPGNPLASRVLLGLLGSELRSGQR